MSTTAKFAMTAVLLLAFALVLGFAPIYAEGEDCGSAFISEDNPFLVSETCMGRTDMVQYWSIVLICAAIIAGVATGYVRSSAEAWKPIK